MGYNLVWFCEAHGEWGYSMRGEEGADFQWIARVHRHCFKRDQIKVMMDCDTSVQSNEESEMWTHEQRPKRLTREQWDALEQKPVEP